MRTLFSILLNIIFIPYKLLSGKSIFSLCDKESLFTNHIIVCRMAKLRRTRIGRYSSVANGTLIINSKIGSFCSISSNCFIGMANHPYKYVSTSTLFSGGKNKFHKKISNLKFNDYETTSIGNDVWIGHGALIKTGIKVGDGAVIGAGSIVTHDVPPYAIVAGAPAKIIKYRFSDDVIKKMLEIKWWDKPISEIKKIATKFDNPESFFETV